MTIRYAVAEDIAIIAEIYDREVLGSTATMDIVPRTADEHRAWLDAHPADRYPVLVLEQAGQVVGWASLTAFSPRKGYARCAEVSVYVHHSARGMGAGGQLLDALIQVAPTVGVNHLLARIEASGTASLRLHHRAGFTTVGTLHQVAEKFGKVLDVALLERLIASPAS